MVAINKEVAEAGKGYAAFQQARAKLEEQPTDPEANLAVGRYLCLSKGDWEKGIPMLALGSDPALKALAVRELEKTESPNAQVALADAWWDLAQGKTGPERESLLLRAGYWYQEAEASLTSELAKVKIRKRLEEIAKLGRPIQEASSGPPLAIAPFDEKQARMYQLRWSKHLRIPAVKTNSIGMKLVLIPPGEFDMGSTQEEIDRFVETAKQRRTERWYIDRISSEGPRHRVKITQPFYLGMYEVTQAEFQRVMGANPSHRTTIGGAAPVEMVSWHNAREFCRRLSEQEKTAGHVYRLPTEAQWEYACRAGTTTSYHFGDDETRLGRHGWFRVNSGKASHLVGQTMPNAWGLYDMQGNVWEICADCFGSDYYQHSPSEDPSGPPEGTHRVCRGASHRDADPILFRSAYRCYHSPDYRESNIGFRVIRTLSP
jgi:formylglycine-generating enzyme required for sulfatase activity